MTRVFIPGGWDCDALPSGAYAVLLVNKGIQTHLGAIALPPGEPAAVRFVRISNVGGFKIAGQAQSTTNPAAYEYRDGSWHALPPPCVGTSPVIYDHRGILHCSDGSIGSQGWRYVGDDGTPEGKLITGDATYGPFHGLNEWSAIGTLYIGQGNATGGVLVWDGEALRVLEPGNCRFIRATADGEHVAIAFYKPEGAVLIWTTLSELRALPLYQSPAPAPVPLPAPKPEPKPMPVVDHTDVVKALATQYPFDRSDAQSIFQFVRRVAWALKDDGCGLLIKRSGENIVSYQGESYSLSRVCYPDGHIYKVLGDAGVGAGNVPGWTDNGTVDPSLYHIALFVGDAPAPVPPPSVPPPAPVPVIDLSPLLNAIADERAEILAIRAELDAMKADLAALVAKPAPTYSGQAKLGLSMTFSMEPKP